MRYSILNTSVQIGMCMNLGFSSDGDFTKLLNDKRYLPDEKDLPKTSIVKSSGNDATLILSKLSDTELVKLLNYFPKRDEYDLDDIMKTSKITKNKSRPREEIVADTESKSINQKEYEGPVYRLQNKEVDPYVMNPDVDPKYNALQKLNNILYSRPREDNSEENEQNKENIFDLLVSQLKSLCCKKNNHNYKSVIESNSETQMKKQTEYIFLILNDEIKSNVNDSNELVPVDPDSLSENSKVLLLGPILNPLSETQIKLVMNRISNELSKSEYLTLLKNISEGSGVKNTDILKSLVTGPETRRYIKPHRCNHQSKLAKIYYGPKWIICTGYINLNTPSLYD